VVTSYTNQSTGTEQIYYRLKVITAMNGQGYASNIISLKSKFVVGGIQVINTNTGDITVRSSDNYAYQLFTTGGQLIASGKLNTGMNQLGSKGAKGLLLLHCSNGNQSFTQKLIKQ
jgi:hypothetical protein